MTLKDGEKKADQLGNSASNIKNLELKKPATPKCQWVHIYEAPSEVKEPGKQQSGKIKSF